MLYMVTWIPSIYPLFVSIYTSTMDPMGMAVGIPGASQLRLGPLVLGCHVWSLREAVSGICIELQKYIYTLNFQHKLKQMSLP